MKSRWMIVSAGALLALAAVIWLGQGVGQAQLPMADLTVGKSVSPSAIAPGQYATYSVTLQNTTGVRKDVSSLVDILPDGFEYVGLAPDSEWGTEPWDKTPPDIQWAGPIPVPASGSVTLRYKVYVPDSVPLSPDPYVNTVTATLAGVEYPAQAGLLVAVGEVSVNKVAASTYVYPGDLLTYTVTFRNSGYVPQSLTTITDVLPDDVTFVGMTPNSEVLKPPSGVVGTITWTGPFTIPSRNRLVLEYVTAMPMTSDTLLLQNLLSGRLENDTVVTDSVEVKVSTSHTWFAYMPWIAKRWAPPRFVATKTANPNSVYGEAPGALVAYEVVLSNLGTVSGKLADIRDTLPAGFTFVSMLPGSGISTPPSGTTGQVAWTGPFTVPGESSLILKYQVRASITPGTYVNSATATALKGQPPAAPAQATVRVIEPILLEEDWESPSPYWRPFLNYWRLKPGQWHYAPGTGVGGSMALKHTCWIGAPSYVCDVDGAEDALYMYLGPDSFEWKDYRFEASVRLNNLKKFQGLWFRGYYEESEVHAQCVGGYLVAWRVGHASSITLSKFPDEGSGCGDLRDPSGLISVAYPMAAGGWYRVAVEVRGSNIKVFLDDTLVIEHNDDTYQTGTVGFWAFQVEDGVWDNVLVTPLP